MFSASLSWLQKYFPNVKLVNFFNKTKKFEIAKTIVAGNRFKDCIQSYRMSRHFFKKPKKNLVPWE